MIFQSGYSNTLNIVKPTINAFLFCDFKGIKQRKQIPPEGV